MNDIQKRVALSMIATEQQRAETISTLSYDRRAFASFQATRGALWTLASALHEEPEIAQAIMKLTETLDEAFYK